MLLLSCHCRRGLKIMNEKGRVGSTREGSEQCENEKGQEKRKGAHVATIDRLTD
jgi:hypothetical protein